MNIVDDIDAVTSRGAAARMTNHVSAAVVVRGCNESCCWSFVVTRMSMGLDKMCLMPTCCPRVGIDTSWIMNSVSQGPFPSPLGSILVLWRSPKTYGVFSEL